MWVRSHVRHIHLDNPQSNHRSKDAYLFTFASLLKHADTLCFGRQAHDHIIKENRYVHNTFLLNFLSEMYGRLGCFVDAQSVFDHMPKHNLHSWNILINVYGQNAGPVEASLVFGRMPSWDVVSWTSIIMAFSQHGYGIESLNLFFEMTSTGVVPNKVTFLCSIEACPSLIQGQDIHISIVKYGYEKEANMGTSLISFYGKCGRTGHANNVFGSMTHHDIASFNAIIAALSHQGQHNKALDFFLKMQLEGINPDAISFVSILDGCRSLNEALDMHGVVAYMGFEQDILVNNTLINLYGKCDSLLDATSVFSSISHRTVVSWNALITAHAENGHGRELLQFFCDMLREGLLLDRVAFLGTLRACTSLAILELGHHMHLFCTEDGYGSHTAIGNTVITMYGCCGSVSDARCVFDSMRSVDTVTWSCIIRVYSDAGLGEAALYLFNQMHLEDFEPTDSILICVSEACAALGALEQGHMVHAYVVELGLDKDMVVENTLLASYGKHGNLLDAWAVFCMMDEHDTISWTGMIAGVSISGCSKEALYFLHKLQHEGINADTATFLCVLVALNHDGEVELSQRVFAYIVRDHSLMAKSDHFLCMIDILGRAGQLDEAEMLITEAPAECASDGWQCLLGACKIHGDTERGARVAEHILRMGLSKSTLLVALSRLYSAKSSWREV